MAAAAFDEEDKENKTEGNAKGIKSYPLSEADSAEIKTKFSAVYADWVKKNEKAIPAQKIMDALFLSAKKNRFIRLKRTSKKTKWTYFFPLW